MSAHRADVRWTRTSSDFTYDTYNRAHEIRFKDGRVRLKASAAPAFKGDGEDIDPEEAFVAALASCHMLSFLAIAARKRLVVDAYEDDAAGFLEKGANNKLWVARVVLQPRVTFGAGVTVDRTLLEDLHHRAHDECFIANSVATDVRVEPKP